MSNPKRYKCKYCEYRGAKEQLIDHISDKHEDIIPEGYTAARITFNIINKKEYGKCMVCGKPTEWDEQAYRYKTFNSEACRQYYKKNIIDKRMINKYGTPTLLNNEQHQKKMLQNRKISGQYKFSSGELKSYVGSYEKKLLEFMDKVLHIPAEDIETPGLTVSYEFDGEEHIWILDLFYIPFNLLIDVKDGGDNKNTNPALEEYREKQKAKEDAITKLGKYNYLRLTNNDFSQLLLTMNQIKFTMKDEQLVPIININESSNNKIDSPYFIAYSDNESSIDGYAISKNESLDESYIVNLETNKIEKKDFEFFRDKKYIMYEFREDLDCDKLFNDLSEDINNNKSVSFDYPYKMITNNRLYIPEQIIADNRFNNIYYSSKNDTSSILERYEEMVEHVSKNKIEKELNNGNPILFPILNESLKLYKKFLLEDYADIDIVEGINEYYIINNSLDTISKPFKNIYDIQLEDVKFMNEIRV